MFSWDEKYLIGVTEIDEQHEKLFEIAGRAYSLLKNNLYHDKYDQIIEIIEELKDYTVFHFETEEKYMQSINYRKFFSHRVEHMDFINKITSLNIHEIDENQDEYLTSILEFVFTWIDEHILQKDKLITSPVTV